MRVLRHIKRLDDQFPLRDSFGRKMTLKDLAPQMRCSRCGKKVTEVIAVARPRPRRIRQAGFDPCETSQSLGSSRSELKQQTLNPPQQVESTYRD